MFAVNELLLTKPTQTSNETVPKEDREEAQTVPSVLNKIMFRTKCLTWETLPQARKLLSQCLLGVLAHASIAFAM